MSCKEGSHRSCEGIHSWLLKNGKKIFEGLLRVNTGWGCSEGGRRIHSEGVRRSHEGVHSSF